MYRTIEEFSNWIKVIKIKKWKYNFIDKGWKLLSKEHFNKYLGFSEWYAAIHIVWKW